ncbi:MAG: beta-L-arabinofuranosidase domain-containing protein [Terracidiphilus sp.]
MQQTEGLANLYVATKDERYRKLAEQIAAVIERRPGDHVHGYLTSLRGVMELYQATGDAQLLAQCEAAWEDVARSQDALITGGVPEGWSPNNHRTEGCAEADWARLNLALWKATGKRAYLETAERAVFNELAFNQFVTGDFGHRLYTETGLPANGAARAWWCCTLHGLRAFPDIHASVFRATKEGLWYDLPMDARIETGVLSAVAESSLGDNGTVQITITSAGTGRDSLFIRKPQWAATDIHITGEARQYAAGDGYVGLERTWAAGDVIELKYTMSLRQWASSDDRVAYFHGPWLLGASAADNPAYFNELTANNRLERGKEKPLAAAKLPKGPFRVAVAATVVPSLPAEYPDQPQSVVLRALAEQTAQPTTAWELKFLGRATG